MALPSSGQLTINDIAVEFGGSVPHFLSEYYAVAPGIPTEGIIPISAFYGAEATEYISATGGTITAAYGRRYHTFTSNGTFNVVESAKGFADDAVEMMVIGGGGSGGQGNRFDTAYIGMQWQPDAGWMPTYAFYQYGGGGGGAGGVDFDIEPDSANLSNKSVVVGSGGAQGTAGSNGGSSYVSGYDVAGGGGHGASSDTYAAEAGQGTFPGRGSGGGGSSYLSGSVQGGMGASGTYGGGQSSSTATYRGYFYTYYAGGWSYIYKYSVNGGGGGGAAGNGGSSQGGLAAFNSTLDYATGNGGYGRGGNAGTTGTGSTSTLVGSGGGGGRAHTSINDTTPDLQAAGSGRNGIVIIYYDYV